MESLQHARGDGSHLKLLDKLSRVQLLIVDDFLLTPLLEWERRHILEVIAGRYGAGATAVASQCRIQDWYPAIGGPTTWQMTFATGYCTTLIGSNEEEILCTERTAGP